MREVRPGNSLTTTLKCILSIPSQYPKPDGAFPLSPQGEFLFLRGHHLASELLINLRGKVKHQSISPWTHCLPQEAHRTLITHDINPLWHTYPTPTLTVPLSRQMLQSPSPLFSSKDIQL